MRKVFTFLFALGFSILANAQTKSPAEINWPAWEEGQDISSSLHDLGLWGDYSGTWEAGGVTASGAVTMTPNPSPWWKGDQPTEMTTDATTDPETNPYPVMGFYKDGAGGICPDMYQIIPLPAGLYTATVNAVYREGTPDDTWTSFKAGNPKKNAHFYVDVININGEDTTLVNDYDIAINTLAFSKVIKNAENPDQGPLFSTTDGSVTWKNDGKYCMKGIAGYEDTDTIFYPNSDEGAANHFRFISSTTPNGNYYHTVRFILVEPAYIRIGLKKTANIAQDWLPWSNMKIFYNGPADEEAQLDIATEACYVAIQDLYDLAERISDEGYSALAALVSDKAMDFENETDWTSLDAVNATKAEALAYRDSAEASFASARALGDLIIMSQDMAVATDFPNKDVFEAAIAVASEVAFAEELEDVSAYAVAFNALSQARATYLDGQEFDEEGNKDFTMLIKQPWFVNAEYNPSYLPVDGNEDTKAWQLTAEGWADRSAIGNPTNYSSAKSGRTDISSDVVLSGDVTVTNQWYKFVNFSGWSPGLQLYYQSSLIGVSDGNNSIDGGTSEICQQLVGLPNGYYSLRALLRGNGNYMSGWHADAPHNIYAKNSADDIVSSIPDATSADANNNMSNGWYEWNPLAWKEHQTGIITVADGKLLIAAQSRQVMDATGFRLFYHGENPEFDKMIESTLASLEKLLDNEKLFAGDKKYIQDRINAINALRPLQGAPAYEECMQYNREANDYYKTATASLAKYTAIDDYMALQGKYAEGSDGYKIVDTPLQYVLVLGTQETETYLDAEDAQALIPSYKSYMAEFDKAQNHLNDEIKAILANQVAYLSQNYATAEELKAYEEEIGIPTNKQIFADLKCETATPENPVDVTELLKNTKLTDSPSEGWTCESTPSVNTYGKRVNGETGEVTNACAELWNAGTFKLHQDVKYLPAGIYKFKVRACYRDGGDINENADSTGTVYNNFWKAAGGDYANWTTGHAKIFGNGGAVDKTNTIKSVVDGKWTSRSFTEWFDMRSDADTYKGLGFLSNWNSVICVFPDELTAADKAQIEDLKSMGDVYWTEDSIGGSLPEDIFDRKVVDGSNVYYYPSSMAGFIKRIAADPEAYNNEVQFDLKKGAVLSVGITKQTSISNDWVIYDDFELYYCGPSDESTPEPNPSVNLLTDDSYNFNKGNVGSWHYLGWNNNGTATAVDPGYNNSAYCMELTSKNPDGDPWGAQLLCDLKEGAKLEIGKNYIVSFWAKGEIEGDYFTPGAGLYPNPEWNDAEQAVLTTEWKQYTYTLACTEANTKADGNTNIYFNHGKLKGKAYVDRILVYDATAEINPDGNLIADDESFAFNGGTTGNWKMQGWNNKGTATAVENGYNGSAYCMELAPNGSATQNYEAQLPNSSITPMEVGKYYSVSFMAKAETEGTEVEFGAQLSPWAAGNKEWNGNVAKLTTDWAEYTFGIDVTDDYPAAGLNCVYFNFGLSASKVYVDHIVILETIAPEVNPENNMIADDASFGFEDGTTGKWNYLGWNNSGTFAVSAPGYGSEGCMALTSKNPAGDPWGAQLLCPLKEPVMRGGEYQITFWAKADLEGDYINPGIAKAYPEPEWNSAPNAELTTEWQKFTYTLVADETNTAEDGNSNFYFNHGKLQGTAYVDRVVVICTKEPVDAIEGVNVDGIRSINRVNLAGQAVGADFKGIVIEGNKKVLRK